MTPASTVAGSDHGHRGLHVAGAGPRRRASTPVRTSSPSAVVLYEMLIGRRAFRGRERRRDDDRDPQGRARRRSRRRAPPCRPSSSATSDGASRRALRPDSSPPPTSPSRCASIGRGSPGGARTRPAAARRRRRGFSTWAVAAAVERCDRRRRPVDPALRPHRPTPPRPPASHRGAALREPRPARGRVLRRRHDRGDHRPPRHRQRVPRHLEDQRRSVRGHRQVPRGRSARSWRVDYVLEGTVRWAPDAGGREPHPRHAAADPGRRRHPPVGGELRPGDRRRVRRPDRRSPRASPTTSGCRWPAPSGRSSRRGRPPTSRPTRPTCAAGTGPPGRTSPTRTGNA